MPNYKMIRERLAKRCFEIDIDAPIALTALEVLALLRLDLEVAMTGEGSLGRDVGFDGDCG